MRASVDRDDIGYTTKAFKYKAFLNGVEVSYCITADEELGMIYKHKTDRYGNVRLNLDKTETLRETLFGKVEIRVR